MNDEYAICIFSMNQTLSGVPGLGSRSSGDVIGTLMRGGVGGGGPGGVPGAGSGGVLGTSLGELALEPHRMVRRRKNPVRP